MSRYAWGMALQDDDVIEFARLYEEEFGESITHDEAREVLANVLGVLKLLMQHPSRPEAAHLSSPRLTYRRDR